MRVQVCMRVQVGMRVRVCMLVHGRRLGCARVLHKASGSMGCALGRHSDWK